MKYLLIAFLLSSVALGQNGMNKKDPQGRKHGHWQKTHDNGKLRYKGGFDHGVPVDTFYYYFPSGDLQAMNVFRGRSGICMSYQYGDGEKIAAMGLYDGREKDSVWTYFNPEGAVIMREPFQDGKRHGSVVATYPDGKKAEVTTYENGRKEGPWRRFFKEGQLMSKGEYLDGSLEGEVMHYYSNGKPRIKANYRRGLRHGFWYFFDANGKLEKKEEFENDVLVKPEESKEN
jgi:antitoxin component YwqK of YwqJK toxin-antitoxin module